MSILKCISKGLKKNAQDAAMVAVVSLTADLKYRIHNEGMKTRGRIGFYKSNYWIKQRQQRGLQVLKVDLQFTGQLFRDLTYGQKNGQAVIGFLSDRSFLLHQDLERYYGRIWRPDAVEQDDFIERFKEELYERLRHCGQGLSID